MKKHLFISTRGVTSAVALTEGGNLIEFNSESEEDVSIVGNIYKGRVEQVVKGMQAAFVNIGRNKNAYLYVGDTVIDGHDISSAKEMLEGNLISAKVGDDVMVQVTKTEIGNKGARLTPNVSIAGRYLVYMPTVNYIGVSRKITDEGKREHLLHLLEGLEDRRGGFIIRTACQDASDEEIIEDAKRLEVRFDGIREEYKKTPVTSVAYREGGILFRAVRDIVAGDVDKITVDDKTTYVKVRKYLAELGMNPDLTELFSEKKIDLFNYYGLTAQILRVLDSNVELENGAYLVIEQTEALTVIDVNTGKYVGTDNLEETVFETNLLAAKAVAAQLRLRNLGGIIVVDFIDMVNEEHKRILMETLSECVKKDRVRTAVVEMTALGLVEITRKKSRTEVKQKLSKPCPMCGGKGYIMTNETLASMIKKNLFDIFKDGKVTSALITLSEENANEFYYGRALTFEISVFWQTKRIYVVPNVKYGQDKFDIKYFSSDVIDVPENAVLLY